MALVLTPLPGIPLVQPGDDLAALIFGALTAANLDLQTGDILVLAQKIVSKAEGCLVRLSDVTVTPRAAALAAETGKDPRLVQVILDESREVLRTRPGVMIVEHRLGFVCASAGVDHSNVAPDPDGRGETVLTLPRDPDASAQALRSRILAETGVSMAVLIIDSHGRAWRTGTVGMAIGVAGMPALQDLRGTPDLFDFRLQITQVGVADELAAAASLVMGQAAEGLPVVHVRGFPYSLRDGSVSELLRPRTEDMFR